MTKIYILNVINVSCVQPTENSCAVYETYEKAHSKALDIINTFDEMFEDGYNLNDEINNQDYLRYHAIDDNGNECIVEMIGLSRA